MSAFEKYEQMRKAAEAARAATPGPETAAQYTRRFLDESGALRAGLEIQAGLAKPFSRVVEHSNGTVELQTGNSEWDYQSVFLTRGESYGTVRAIGRTGHGEHYSDIPAFQQEHVVSWVASAFINPEERHVAPPPPRPAPTPPPPPERPRNFISRWLDRQEENRKEREGRNRLYYSDEARAREGR